MNKLWLVCGNVSYNDCDFPFVETVVAENEEQAISQADNKFISDKECEGWSIDSVTEIIVKGYTISVKEEN